MVCLLAFGNAHAQVSTLDYSTSAQSYSALVISGGTLVSSSTSATDDDNNYATQPIGFSFNYGGSSFTSVGISANGYLKLGATTTTSYSAVLSAQTNVISPLNMDLQGKGNAGTSHIRIQTLGSAPNRVCVVQWSDWGLYPSSSNTGETYNFQVRLYETTDAVQIVYGNMSTSTTTSPQMGLNGAVVTDFSIRTGNTSSWAVNSAATSNTSTMTMTTTNKPDTGRTFTFANLPMVFNGVTTYQVSGNASAGLNNNPILAAVASTTGNLNPKVVYAIDFNTAGSQNLFTNVTAARVLYTGNVASFTPSAVIRQFGIDITSPSGTLSFTSAGDTLRSGNNYYWLVYDIPTTANLGDTLDATCTSFTDSITRIPTVTNPAGQRIISGPLSGVYTIGGSGSRNYASINAALTDLYNVGVAGPVTFNLAAGTYTGQVIIPNTPVTGASAVNNITFDGINASTRILSASMSNSATVLLNGCKYFTFKNLTITNTISGGGAGVAIIGNNTNDAGSCNTIKNCIINLPNVGTNTAYGISVTATAGGVGQTVMRCDSIVLDSNTITGAGGQGPYYGINVYGASSSLYNRGIRITGNTVNAYYMGMVLYYNYNPMVVNYNTVNMSTSYGYYGIYAYYNQHSNNNFSTEFIGNRVTNFGGYGMYLYFGGSGGTSTAPARIYNNVLNNGTNASYGYYGIYLYNTGYSEVLHNTIRMTYPGTSTSYTAFYNTASSNVIVKNNVFAVMSGAGSTVPAYFNTSPNTGNVNYNLYYNGANSTLLYRGSALTALNYRTATGGGDTSFTTTSSPFVSTSNFSLINGCIGKGIPFTSVPLDITGFTRNSPPDLGAFEFQGGAAGDLSIDRLITPVAPITLGTQDLVFRVKNLGTTAVTSFDAQYTLNGGTPVTQSWFGTLATCDTVSVVFTSGQQITLGNSNAIKVYTANPNFSVDPNRTNDTLSVTYLAPMNGAYTINPSAPASATNFQTFAAADAALFGSGISGPVTITVAPGTYTSRVVINGPIVGANDTTRVVFDGVNATSRIIAANLNAQSVVQFNGSKYVTFQNFTINNTNTSNCSGVGINSSNVIVKNNIINMTAGSTTTTSYGVNITNSTAGYGSTSSAYDSVYVDSNTINGGYYGIYCYGNTSGTTNSFFDKYRWNTLNGTYYYGIYHYYANGGVEINGNKIFMNSSNTGSTYGIYFYGYNSSSISPPTPNRILNNVVRDAAYMGMYIYYPYGTSTSPAIIANNMVLGGFKYSTAAYGIYLYNTAFANVFHNTVNLDHPSASSTTYSALYSSGSSNHVVKNNIFMVTGGGTANCIYFGTSPNTGNVNYNVYYNTANTNIVYRGSQYSNTNFKTVAAGGDSSNYGLPAFANFATKDFHMTNGCTNKGVNLTAFVSTDFEGDLRSTTPNIGADEFVGGASDDIAVDALLSPSFPIVAGSNDVIVRVRNVGANTVTSFDLSYTVNGGTPVTTGWTGTLAACDTVSVNIGTPFTVVSNLQYNLKVYTANPNYSTDPNRGNDTTTSIVATPMNGYYTIGATASDYTTFNNAMAALQLRGVDGPVTFGVKSGVYNESVNLVTVSGMSATNRVTFTSVANNRDSVRLVWPSTTGNTYVLQFTGNNYTVNAITIHSSATSVTTYGVNIGANASYDTLSNCYVKMPVYYQVGYTSYSIYANSVSGIGMGFVNNRVTGSYYGVYYYGNSTNRPKYTYFANNTFDSSYYSPFYYLYYTNYTKFVGNNFISRPTLSGTTNYWYWYYNDSNYTFNNNTVTLGSGISTYWYNYYRANTPTARGIVSNNSVTAEGMLNWYWGNSVTSNIDFFNNSINAGTGYFYLANSGLTSIRIKNNIFGGTGSTPYYLTATPSASVITQNYNLFFSTNSTTPIYAGSTYSLNTFRAAFPAFDKNSVSYRPAFTSFTNTTPNVNDTAIWILNGRGDYIPEVPTDINGNPRPATVADGAPDLGAFNVNPNPATLAPMAIASPAAPTAGTTQVFTFGTDTVASITWDAFTTPPATIAVRQYSGRAPQTIGTVTNYMNFYTDIQAPTGTYLYDIKVNYHDNWMGTMGTSFGFTEADLRLAKKDATSAWATNMASVVDSSLNTLTGTGYTGFSWFTGSDVYNPLPVKLTTFNGNLVNQDAKLTWNTASEVNSNMFVLERSVDGKNFEAVGKVKAAGNSVSVKAYQYTDKGVLTLVNRLGAIYYRLKVIDNDGSFEYSKTITIKSADNTKDAISVNPNPFTSDLNINIEVANDTKAAYEIVDLNGKTVLSATLNVIKGASSINIDGAERLKQGIYFVRVSTDLGTQVFKLVKN